MGARAFLISDILRILTPEEISHLTTTSEADSRMSLTDVIKKYQKGELIDFTKRLSAQRTAEEPEGSKEHEEEAKVLSFDRSSSVELEKKVEEVAEPLIPIAVNSSKPQVETSPLKPPPVPEKKSSEETPDTPSFILGEKKRFEQVTARIREREIHKMYQKSAAVDVQAERSLKEDLSKSTQLGILIDKKQA